MKKCLEILEIPNRRVFYRRDINNYFVKHTHDFWEFMIICRGNYKQRINNELLEMYPGEAILIHPKDIHQVLPGKPDDYHLNILISCDFFREICNFFQQDLYFLFEQDKNIKILLHPNEFEKISNFLTAVNISTVNNQDITIVEQLLISYIITIIYSNRFLQTNKYPDDIKNFITLLSLPENIALNAQEAVKLSNYSYSYFEKKFKEATKISLQKFIVQNKMEYAKKILSKGHVSLVDLSLMLGYDSLSHFSRIFKKNFGISPGKYMKNCIKNI